MSVNIDSLSSLQRRSQVHALSFKLNILYPYLMFDIVGLEQSTLLFSSRRIVDTFDVGL